MERKNQIETTVFALDKDKGKMANDHLIEFHLIEIVIFHLIESFN